MAYCPVIHGDRICRLCKGFCHDGSWRTKHKPHRQHYWCSKACLIQSTRYLSNIDILLGFERIDVISR